MKRTRQQSALLHELRVHLRLGPGKSETMQPFELHAQLRDRQHASNERDNEFHNKTKELARRCLTAGLPGELILKIVKQGSHC